MKTTPNYALRYPESTDQADGPTHIFDLASDVDGVLKGTIWTPLDNRLKALEAVGPPAPAPTTQNGEWVLGGAVNLPAAAWQTLYSVNLAKGTWLVIAQIQVYATDNTNPGHTTGHLLVGGAIKASGGGFPDDRAGTLQIVVMATCVLGAASTPVVLQAYNSQGKSQIIPTAPNPEAPVATRMEYVKLA